MVLHNRPRDQEIERKEKRKFVRLITLLYYVADRRRRESHSERDRRREPERLKIM